MIKVDETKNTEVKAKEFKSNYKGKNFKGKGRGSKCPYCGERESEYLEKRGNQLNCLTCGNDSEI